MPHKKPLRDYLSPDWQRHVDNVRQAASRLWVTPAHTHAIDHGPDHADRVVALLDGLTTGLSVDSYSEEDVKEKADEVYHHVFRVYPTVPSPYYGVGAAVGKVEVLY
jgi:hypothetical protein